MNREDEEEDIAGHVDEHSTCKKAKQKRRSKSEAWAHYYQTDEGPECKYCGQGFSTTTATGTLMNHVKRKHEDEDAVVENRKTADFSKGHADVLVGKLVANKCLPMSLVEDEDFIELMAYLRSGYKPPKRHKLTKVMLPAAKARLMVVMKRKMRSIGHFSLTLDSWTSAANRSYIAVTLHGITALCRSWSTSYRSRPQRRPSSWARWSRRSSRPGTSTSSVSWPSPRMERQT